MVALESTIIAHGLPYPDNLDIARDLEESVRQAGATPATIAVIDGVPCIGLDPAGLEHIARQGSRMAKSSASDLAAYVARGKSAATTVSATAILAERAGIRVFATGGIGGVHRGGGSDISCDIGTLARVPIAVVSAGAKAILDLPRTLQVLESMGVLVVGYRTNEFPRFYTPSSGLFIEHRLDTPAEVASIMRARFDELGQGGILLANPVPDDAALDPALIDTIIDDACDQAERAGVSGKALTPFLLARIAEASGGASVRTNRALAVANARLAGEVASAYARLAESHDVARSR